LAALGRFVIGFDFLYRFFLFDPLEASPQALLFKHTFLPTGFRPELVRDPRRIVSEVRVAYARRWDKSDSDASAYSWHTDDSEAATVWDLYTIKRSEPYRTLLTTEADARVFAKRLVAVYGRIYDTIPITVKPQVLPDISAGDVIVVELDYPQRSYLGWAQGQVLRRDPDMDANRVTLELRLLARRPGGEELDGGSADDYQRWVMDCGDAATTDALPIFESADGGGA
jgi:hypothetical protein